jgi:GNAT superfamily N-acetyltransferase
MDPQEILCLYDQQMRRSPAPCRSKVHQLPGLTYTSNPPDDPIAGWVLYTHLTPEDVDQSIRSVVDFYKPHGGEFEWKVYEHDTPDDLQERLITQGFVSEEPESLLALDLQATPESFWHFPSVDVRRISDPAQLSVINWIESEVWGEPFGELQEYLAEEMRAAPSQISVFVAWVDGAPASCAWIIYQPERAFADLYGGATIPSQRGKGLYTTLIKVRALEAHRRGVRFLTVDASSMSRPVLEKHGFVYLATTQPFVMKF